MSKFGRKIKLTLVGLLIVLVIPLQVTAAGADQPVSVPIQKVPLNFVIDGQLYQTPSGQEGFLYQYSTYVPLRFAAYIFGYSVGWDGANYKVTVGHPSDVERKEIDLYKGKHVNDISTIKPMDSSTVRNVKLNVYIKPVQYEFFTEAKLPPASLPGMIINDALYVPFRFFAESIGSNLEYDGKTFTITALSNPKEGDPANAEQPNVPPADGATSDTPAIVGGSGPQAPGGGGKSQVKAKATIISETETVLSRLEASCTNRLTAAYLRYVNAKSNEETQSAINDGYLIMDSCDSSFESIITDFTKQMADNGHEYTDLVNSYRKTYEDKKQSGLESLLQ